MKTVVMHSVHVLFFFLLNLKLAVGALHLMSERTESLQKIWKFRFNIIAVGG